MIITDFGKAIDALNEVGSGIFHTTHGTFYGTLDTYEGPGDNDRHESCMTLMTENLFDGLLYESEFISLEIPDKPVRHNATEAREAGIKARTDGGRWRGLRRLRGRRREARGDRSS